MQDRVDALIQEVLDVENCPYLVQEMKSFVPRNYLADWPMPEIKFDSHPGLQVGNPFHCITSQKEWERVREKKPLAGFDVTKYTLEEPSDASGLDAASWEKSIKIAQMQLEYQKEKLYLCITLIARMENLQLLEKFGSNAWRKHNDGLDAIAERQDCVAVVKSSFDNDLKEVQAKTQAINRKRMNDQQRSYEKLNSLKEQALELQMKNYIMTVGGERKEERCGDTQKTCDAMEEELRKRQKIDSYECFPQTHFARITHTVISVVVV